MLENDSYKRINFLILCHKSPLQVKKLIERLQSPISRFYVHVDMKSDITEFETILSDFQNVSLITERVNSLWGDISLVKATLNLIHSIKDLDIKGHTVLLSGQDIPLHPIQDIISFLKKNVNNNFIDLFKIPYPHWNLEGKDRLTFYNLHSEKMGRLFCSLPPLKSSYFFRKSTIKQMFLLFKYFPIKNIKYIFKERKQPDFIKQWYGGAQWWTLKNSTISSIKSKLKENPEYLDFHEHTHVPDEIFFHTIVNHLENNPNIKSGLTYINWSRKNCDLPVTFTNSKEDINELLEAKKDFLFARKVEDSIDIKKLFNENKG